MGFEILVTVDIANLDPEADDPIEIVRSVISDLGGSIVNVGKVGNNFISLTIFYRTKEDAKAAQAVLNRLSQITSITEPQSSTGKVATSSLTLGSRSPTAQFTPEEKLDVIGLRRKQQIINFNTPRGI